MSQGIELLFKIIDSQSIFNFREIETAWISSGDERLLYDFINNHLNRYSQLPSRDVAQQNGYDSAVVLDQPIEYYLQGVKDRYIITQARDQSVVLIDAVTRYNPGQVREVCRILQSATDHAASHLRLTSFQDEARNALDRALEIRRGVGLSGVTMGYSILDEQTAGFQPGDLDVLVGRIYTGKTMILINMIHRAWLSGHTPLFISLEMSNIQLATRTLALNSGTNPTLFKTGRIASFHEMRLLDLITGLDNRPAFHFLVGQVRKSLSDVEYAIERTDPSIIYIDAGYLLSTDRTKRTFSRREAIAEVMESLKGLAVKTNKPIVVTVQFNRLVKPKYKDKEPEMSLDNIGETDVIGQIASNVIGIHPPKKDPLSLAERTLEALKIREGPLVKFKTNFLFDPPNFDFICRVDEDGEREDADQQRRTQEQMNQLGWMV